MTIYQPGDRETGGFRPRYRDDLTYTEYDPALAGTGGAGIVSAGHDGLGLPDYEDFPIDTIQYRDSGGFIQTLTYADLVTLGPSASFYSQYVIGGADIPDLPAAAAISAGIRLGFDFTGSEILAADACSSIDFAGFLLRVGTFDDAMAVAGASWDTSPTFHGSHVYGGASFGFGPGSLPGSGAAGPGWLAVGYERVDTWPYDALAGDPSAIGPTEYFYEDALPVIRIYNGDYPLVPSVSLLYPFNGQDGGAG